MSTPKVDYVYADGSANTIRREGYVQPNGQPVEFLFDYPAGDQLSRVGSLVVGAPADGLRAFWKLDENVSSGPRHDSVGNDTLTDANNNVGVGTGLFGGQAALFDATAATALYTYPTPANLQFGNQDFTTAGWIKYTSFPGVGGTIGAWGNGNAGNANPLEQEWILYVLRTDKHLRWLVSDGTHYGEIDSGVAMALNTWYFVVAWYDAAQGRNYVQVNNGTPVYASYTYGPSARNRGFALGRTNDNFMSGLIQNVGVWDRVLTADERTALYNSGSGVQFFNHARYSYLGASAPVVVDYPQPQVQYNLATGSGAGTYAGLDRFGRVKDCHWQTMASSPTDVAQLKYGYDRASNRLWREDPVAKAQSTPKYFDELYNYDAVYRLTGMQRGQLTGTPPSGVSNKNFAQGWNLDPTGNWKGFTEAATGGSDTLVQSRTANPVNEITDITNTTGSAWAQPGYDAAGNMTSVPQPADMSATYQAKYDAWNRLVELRDKATGNLVQINQYDGLTRRTVQQTFDSAGTLAEERHYYYSDSWQVLEERVGSTPESSPADRRYVWGLRYIDDLVLRDRSISGGTLNERLFALQDANWNVVALCSSSGAVQQRFAYSPYGVPLFLNADFTPGSNDFVWETLFCGYRWEAATGMHSVRYRWLHSILGCWIGRDRLHIPQGRYAYVLSRPMLYTDPQGLLPQGVFSISLNDLANLEGNPKSNLLQSEARVRWYPPKHFESDGDCECTTVRLYQIARYVAKWSRQVLPGEDVDEEDWHYDDLLKKAKVVDWIPCSEPVGDTKPGKIGSSPNMALIVDNPGLDSGEYRILHPFNLSLAIWAEQRIRFLQQEFETCAVCLGGRRKYEVFGCIQWQHNIRRGPESPRLHKKLIAQMREGYGDGFIAGADINAYGDKGIEIDGRHSDEDGLDLSELTAGLQPSKEFLTLLRKKLGPSVRW